MVPSNALRVNAFPRQCACCFLNQHVVSHLGLSPRRSAAYAVIMISLLWSLAACLFPRALHTSLKACRLSDTQASNPPLHSTPSMTGVIASNCVRASRANSRRNGVGFEINEGLG